MCFNDFFCLFQFGKIIAPEKYDLHLEFSSSLGNASANAAASSRQEQDFVFQIIFHLDFSVSDFPEATALAATNPESAKRARILGSTMS